MILKSACSLILVLVFLFTTPAIAEDILASTAESASKWTEILKDLEGYSYDKFEKEWNYYGAYLKQYSDGTFVLGLEAKGEDEESVEYVFLYSWLRDEKNQKVLNEIENIKFLVNDQLFECPMRSVERMSCNVIPTTGAGRKLILELMKANQMSIRIEFPDRNSLDLDLSKEDIKDIKTFTYNIIKYGMLDCCVDQSTISYYEKNYPIRVEE